METKTVFTKGNHTVEVVSCTIVINNVVKHFHIKGTDKYYVRQKTACQIANELLIEKSLSEEEYQKRKELKVKVRKARKVIHVYNCMKETEDYIKKWDGVLFLETKKGLCNELKTKLDLICKKFKFENAKEAINLVDNINYNKHKFVYESNN